MFTVLDRVVPPCSYKRQYITEIKRINNTKFDTKVPKVTRRHDVTSDASCTRFARSSGAVEQWSTEDLLQSMCLPCWRRPKPWWRSLALELRIVPWTVSSLSAHCQLIVSYTRLHKKIRSMVLPARLLDQFHFNPFCMFQKRSVFACVH